MPLPERAIEHEILGPEATIALGRTCLGGAVIGGINAVPLTSTPKIEAELLLLGEHTNGPHLYLTEVKAMANTPWYATIELLRQLRLLLAKSPARGYFRRTAGLRPTFPSRVLSWRPKRTSTARASAATPSTRRDV